MLSKWQQPLLLLVLIQTDRVVSSFWAIKNRISWEFEGKRAFGQMISEALKKEEV